MAASTVSTLQSFPSPGSIPPACFYNAQGLASWLNLNPEYKFNFSSTQTFPYLFPPGAAILLSTIGFAGYNPAKVPLCSNVTTLSQYQGLKYNTQLMLFHKVYTQNSNAYINFISTGQSPKYYTFITNQERSDMNSAVALVNKLYPFKDMAQALGWIVPFPLS
jgi:hypothetical protein